MGRGTQRDLKGKEMPQRRFRCCDPGAVFGWIGGFAWLWEGGGQGLWAYPDLTPCLNLYFFFFAPGFAKQGGTFSYLEMVSIESDILIDALEIKETIFPNFFSFPPMCHITGP